MPNETEVCVIQSDCEAVQIDSLNNIPQKAGFILYPFSSDSSCKSLFIEASKSVNLSIAEVNEISLQNNQNWEIKHSLKNKKEPKTKEDLVGLWGRVL